MASLRHELMLVFRFHCWVSENRRPIFEFEKLRCGHQRLGIGKGRMGRRLRNFLLAWRVLSVQFLAQEMADQQMVRTEGNGTIYTFPIARVNPAH